MLFQDGALFSSLSVEDNVATPLFEHTELPQVTCRQLARLKLAMAGLPPDAARKRPSELSGGMRKRVALARALALDPELLFLDEPTSGLDPISARAFDALIRLLADSLGLTVFLVTHDLDTLFSIIDRVIVLSDGRVLGSGTRGRTETHRRPVAARLLCRTGARGRNRTWKLKAAIPWWASWCCWWSR